MNTHRWKLLAAAALAAAVLSSGSLTGAYAHERRTVGPVMMRVGWANEPTYSGFMNAVQLFLSDKDKKPISGAGDTLKVQVTFADQKTAMLPLDESDERPGEYLAPLIPDRPGNYTFHFVGTVAGRQSTSRSPRPRPRSTRSATPRRSSSRPRIRRSPTSRGSWTG